jgi:hypothetical protein
MLDSIGPGKAHVWGWYVLIGGAVCIVGVLGSPRLWFLEWSGLLLVGTAAGIYAWVAANTLDSVPGRAAGVLLLTALTVLLLARWVRVISDELQDRHELPSASRHERA